MISFQIKALLLQTDMEDKAMSNKEVRDFSEKLKQGLELAEQRMLQEKALRGEDLIVSSDGINFQRISAKELIKR